MRKAFPVALLTLVLSPLPAIAITGDIVTICRGSKGKAYFAKPSQGWIDDGIANNTMVFIKLPNGEYDIAIGSDAKTFSATADGAVIALTHEGTGRSLTLVAMYPAATVEVYQLTLDSKGRGILIWSSMKNGPPPAGIVKGSMFTAQCAAP